MKKATIFILMTAMFLVVANTARAQKQLYTATILRNGGVKVDFDLAEANRYSTSFLEHPARITKSAEVEGLKDKVVELLKTNIGPDWNPVLLMRTANGNVFLLNIRETIDVGDYTCGQVQSIKNAKGLKVIKQQGQYWTTPAAILKEGKTAAILGSDSLSGYYVIDDYDVVINITSDYGINITNKKGEPIANGSWYQSWEGNGMVVMSCCFDKGKTEIEMYLDDNSQSDEEHPSFKIYSITGQTADLLPFDKKLHSRRLYKEPY